MNSKQHTKNDFIRVNRLKGKETLMELVFKEIEDYIVRTELKPGDRLPLEAELAHQLGCGRYSVREALRSLDALKESDAVRAKEAMEKDFSEFKRRLEEGE